METTVNDNITAQDVRFMEMAARIAEENIDRGGGPFGAVIVRDGEIVGECIPSHQLPRSG